MHTRCQKLALEVIDHTALSLEKFIALDRADQTDDRSADATNDAELLEQMFG